MRFLTIVALALTATVVHAASPEESYFAARDSYLAKFKKLEESGKVDDRATKEEESARGDLAQQLRQIIEPHGAEGIAQPGRFSLETLFPSEIGADMLDGLIYSFENKGELLVSTNALFTSWLKARQKSWTKPEKPPQTLDQALKSDFFYTLAFSPDAAVTRYAELAIAKRAKANIAVAMLDLRSQDDTGPAVPNEIIVSVVRDGKLFIASAPVKAEVVADPACEKTWRHYEAKADEAFEAYKASNQKNEKLFAKYTKLQEAGGAAFRRCFTEKVTKAPLFTALTQEAQKLADRLAGK